MTEEEIKQSVASMLRKHIYLEPDSTIVVSEGIVDFIDELFDKYEIKEKIK